MTTRTSLHIRFSFSHYFFISHSEMQSPNSRVHDLKYAWDAHILNVYYSSLNALNTCFCVWVTSICMDLCGRMFLCICRLVMSLHTLVFKFTSKHKPRQMCECSFFICCDKFSALLLWGCVLKTGSGTRLMLGYQPAPLPPTVQGCSIPMSQPEQWVEPVAVWLVWLGGKWKPLSRFFSLPNPNAKHRRVVIWIAKAALAMLIWHWTVSIRGWAFLRADFVLFCHVSQNERHY